MKGDHLLTHRHGDRSGEAVTGMVTLDFSVNLAPIVPPLPELSSTSFSPVHYPSIDGQGLREFYAARFGLDRQSVLATNGAIEGIYLLPRALGLKRVLIAQPSFFDYGRACRLAGADVVALPLDEADGFAFPEIETVAGALEECDALFVANPGNPTGTLIPRETLLRLACRFPDKLFIVDEAFIQFTEAFPSNSLMPEVGACRNVIVIHSLTKFYSIAGLRLGAIVAHPSMTGMLYGHKEPWTVNAVAEQVAGLLLHCRAHEDRVRTLVAEGRRQFTEGLAANTAVRLCGGSANFFFASVSQGLSLDRLFGFLGSRGILVRDCSNFEGVPPRFFRFCIRTREDNGALVDALNDYARAVASVPASLGEAVS